MAGVSPAHEREVLNKTTQRAITDQLNRLVTSPFFSHSKRFPIFLRFVVEQTLAGEADNIKERTLGIEIFERDANYDTASDPIVRVTAAEIRKRVAQYYQDPSHERELCISLPPGSYIPQFSQPKGGPDYGLPEKDSAFALPIEQPAPTENKVSRHIVLAVAGALVAAGLLVTGTVLIWQRTHRSAFESFWQPVLGTKAPSLLCVADQTEYSVIALRDAADPAHQTVLKDNLTAVVIDDLDASIKVAGILESSGKQYSLKGEGATTLDDLRHGPSVFVGAFDNEWTLRLTNPLRFHFANDPDMMHLQIVDSKAHGPSPWFVDRGVQLATNNYRDYAIIARFTDGNTGNVAVVVAGIGRGGTRVAGEFLTDNADLAQLMRAAHDAGDKKNMEAVLSTQIIDGEPGSPKLEAAYFW
jgi:hypothetical protein